MNRVLVVLGFILLPFVLRAQEDAVVVIDSLYREDQFYGGVTYNVLSKAPKEFSQSGFSGSYHLGFIRDMPINKNRNFAFGIGLGLSSNSYNQNLLIDKDNTGKISYTLLENGSTYTKNKFTSYVIECPFEIRWRTSTFTEYNFWRIYAGFKLGYVFAHNTKFKGDMGKIKHNNISHFNDLQYGLTLSVGYNTWNIHCHYTINPIFSKEAQLNGNTIDMNALKIGVMFYIL